MVQARIAAALLCALVAGAGALAYGASQGPSRAEEVAEGEIAGRINVLRAQYLPDAPRLLYDPELVAIARARSRAIANGAPFSHQDAKGRYPAIDMITQRFGRADTVGENLFAETRGERAFDAAAFGKRSVDEWMASQEHRENILLPDFTATGIGVVVKGNTAYATQIFRGPPRPN